MRNDSLVIERRPREMTGGRLALALATLLVAATPSFPADVSAGMLDFDRVHPVMKDVLVQAAEIGLDAACLKIAGPTVGPIINKLIKSFFSGFQSWTKTERRGEADRAIRLLENDPSVRAQVERSLLALSSADRDLLFSQLGRIEDKIDKIGKKLDGKLSEEERRCIGHVMSEDERVYSDIVPFERPADPARPLDLGNSLEWNMFHLRFSADEMRIGEERQKYVEKMDQLRMKTCPEGFRAAYREHISAWERVATRHHELAYLHQLMAEAAISDHVLYRTYIPRWEEIGSRIEYDTDVASTWRRVKGWSSIASEADDPQPALSLPLVSW